MKTYLLLTAIAFSGSTSEAQTNKGSIMLGGSAGFNSSVSKSSSENPDIQNTSNLYSYLSFSPSFAYFIKDRLALGSNLGFSRVKQAYTYPNEFLVQEQTYIQENISVNLFARKYISVNSIFSFFGGISAGGGPSSYLSSSVANDVKSTGNKTKGYLMRAGIDGGIAYFPSKRFGLHAGLGGIGWNYHENKSEDSKSSGSSINASMNSLVMNFGLYYFLNK